MPVRTVHQHSTHHQKRNDGANLYQHHDVVGPRRFANAPHQKHSQNENDEKRRDVEVSARPVATRPDRRRPVIWYMESKRGELCFQISPKTDRHSHIADRIFQNQVPANDPRDQFTQSRVRIRIRAPSNRDHRSQFGIAQTGEAARNRYQKK